MPLDPCFAQWAGICNANPTDLEGSDWSSQYLAQPLGFACFHPSFNFAQLQPLLLHLPSLFHSLTFSTIPANFLSHYCLNWILCPSTLLPFPSTTTHLSYRKRHTFQLYWPFLLLAPSRCLPTRSTTSQAHQPCFYHRIIIVIHSVQHHQQLILCTTISPSKSSCPQEQVLDQVTSRALSPILRLQPLRHNQARRHLPHLLQCPMQPIRLRNAPLTTSKTRTMPWILLKAQAGVEWTVVVVQAGVPIRSLAVILLMIL